MVFNKDLHFKTIINNGKVPRFQHCRPFLPARLAAGAFPRVPGSREFRRPDLRQLRVAGAAQVGLFLLFIYIIKCTYCTLCTIIMYNSYAQYNRLAPATRCRTCSGWPIFDKASRHVETFVQKPLYYLHS